MTYTFENIERLFNDEVREKKRTGRGAFAMRGKGVKHGLSGAIRTPYHFMSAKERKKLNGEVEVSNMYETIISYEEFQLKEEEMQKNMLARWREIYPTKKIKEDMEISNTAFYNLVEKLEIPKVPRGGSKKRQGNVKSKSIAVSASPEIQKEPQTLEFRPKLVEKVTQESEPPKTGLHLEYNGDYNCDDLNKLFTKLQVILDGEVNKYKISLKLTEIQEDKL